MLHYPKIPGSRNCPTGRCIAFEKYDGTNIHFDWDRDFGWHALGTRRDTFNLTPEGISTFTRAHTQLGECASVFERTLAPGLECVFRDHPEYRECQGFVVFAEFLGPNSFAGLHKAEDPKELRLFDVEVIGVGLVGPHRFATDFRHLPIARIVYEGKLTGQFAEDVRNGRYGVAEGVVCKGGGGDELWMVKIKTYAYLERLKRAFGDRWEDYWE